MEKNIRKNRKNKMTRNNKALVVIDIQNENGLWQRVCTLCISSTTISQQVREHSSLVAKARNLRLK